MNLIVEDGTESSCDNISVLDRIVSIFAVCDRMVVCSGGSPQHQIVEGLDVTFRPKVHESVEVSTSISMSFSSMRHSAGNDVITS